MASATPDEAELERRLRELLMLDSRDLMQTLARLQHSDPETFSRLRHYIEQRKKKGPPV
jgi:hypothetical protein